MLRILFLIVLLVQTLPVLAKPTILVIESYHSESAWDTSYKKGIESVLGDDYLLIYVEMDTKRLPVSLHRKQAEMAWQRYLELEPDLVILGDDNALKYLGPRFSETSIPVVYLGINNNPRIYHVHQSANITGILERPLAKRAVSSISQLLPKKPKRILVLLDDSLTANNILQQMFSGSTNTNISGVEVELRLLSNWNDWQDSVLNLQHDNFGAVVFGLYHTLQDQVGQHVRSEDVLQWSVENTTVPPFAFWDFAVGKDKTIGGLVLSGFEQGREAAHQADTILTDNVMPHSLGPKTAMKGQYLFSRSQLQRYGITLPADIAEKASFVD